MTFLGQLPTPAAGAVENWLFAAAAVGSLVLIGRKLLFRQPARDAEFVTRAEFHRELSAVSDKIDARFFALSEKVEAAKGELLASAERNAARIEGRLHEVEGGLARVDERTRH